MSKDYDEVLHRLQQDEALVVAIQTKAEVTWDALVQSGPIGRTFGIGLLKAALIDIACRARLSHNV